MATLRCSIVTPNESLLDEEVTYVRFPAWDGQRGVMPGASPFLVKLSSGELRLDFPQGGSHSYLVDGGFAQMQGEMLTLLVDSAVPTESLDANDASKALDAAKAASLAVGHTTPEERDRLEHDQTLAYQRAALAKQGKPGRV